jgi:two-component sensor histidine kinase
MLAYLKAMRGWPWWVRLGLMAMVLASVYLFQIPLEREVPGEPFLLFFLVVMAAALTFGEGVGLLGVALSTLLSFFFFEPTNSLALHHAADLVKIELYALLAVGCVVGLARLAKALIAADEAARALARSEAAHSVLLRELAHRVANNFAAVASLIRRKANLVGDAEAKSVLNEAVEQVMVLARVHSRLRPESDEIALDSKAFLEELCDDLKVLIAPGQRLAIQCVPVSRRLSVAQAIPLGLIVNELVTNAIKHAFADGRAGTVRVRLQEAGGQLVLNVEDDGIGVGASRIRGIGLGQDLVRALCQQLGGTLAIKSTSAGSTFGVAFQSAGLDGPRTCVPASAAVLH